MDRVLLQVRKRKDRHRLEEWLSKTCHILLPDAEHPLEAECDLVIIDGPSLRALRPKVRARRKAEEPVLLPFLLITVRRRSSMPGRHLGRVVDDVIVRPLNEQEIKARVANLLRMRHWSQELEREHERVMKLAVTDDVSGFNNTRYLHRYLDRVLDGPGGKGIHVSLVFFDLDNFKRLVDAHGHLLGAKALREVAQTVHRVLDEEDRLVRYGGDEFIAILPRQTKHQASAKVARMKDIIAETQFLAKEGINAHLTASFGLASYPEDAKNERDLLAEADRCLFQSKAEGKDRITVVDFAEAA
ncbi:MAG: GGDEF domain-containing protein [Verrucomicrobia bacterium]|nr:MAG: GGDEF domain-containing protein [Verrucomicrobiota bacterium]